MTTPPLDEAQFELRECRPGDGGQMRRIKQRVGQEEMRGMDAERRVVLRLGLAGEMGAGLSDPARHFAPPPHRIS